MNWFDKLNFKMPIKYLCDIDTASFILQGDKFGGGESLTLRPELLDKVLGLNRLVINKQEVYLSVSGKILSSKGTLGLISMKNIYEVFENIEKTEYLKFTEGVDLLDEAVLLACDSSVDLRVDNVSQSIEQIKLLAKDKSDKIRIHKYRTGLVFSPYAKSDKTSFCCYDKYREICHSSRFKGSEYIDRIGREYLEEIRNRNLRLELRLSTFKTIREAFNIERKGYIKLKWVLKANTNPVSKYLKMLTSESTRKVGVL